MQEVAQRNTQTFGDAVEGIHGNVLATGLDAIDKDGGKVRLFSEFFLT